MSRNAGKFLSNLKDDRESGDYEVFTYIDKDTGRIAVEEAEGFLKETKDFLLKNGLIDSA